jgi:integrase
MIGVAPSLMAHSATSFVTGAIKAELHHCSAHGLRKAGATIAANNGATAHQLMAIFGWDTIKEAEKYTSKADQLRLAKSAMHMLEVRESTAK